LVQVPVKGIGDVIRRASSHNCSCATYKK